jgi:Carboxypeptidase regulatory-like domain
MYRALRCQPSCPHFKALYYIILSLAIYPQEVYGQLNHSLLTSERGASHAEFVVTGMVLNSVTNEPVPRALVSMSSPQRFALTGFDGKFRFDRISAGLINVTVQKPGFFSEEQLRHSQYKLIKVGADIEQLLLKLTPEAIITGRVEDASGESIEGATVEATFIHIVNGRRQKEKRGGSNTDENGEFRIANLMPGSYYVSVQASYQRPPQSGRNQNSEEGYPLIVHWPGVRDIGEATPIQLGPSQRTQLNFSLKPEPVFTISGSVVGYMPGQYVNLGLLSPSGDYLPAQLRFEPRTGKFEGRHLPAGDYKLTALQGNAAGHTLASELPLNLTSDRHDLVFHLQPQRSIPIIVHADSLKMSSLPSPKFSPSQMVSIHLFSDQPGIPDLWSTLDSSSGEVRGLNIKDTRPAKYFVEIIPNGSWYVESAIYGNTDVLKEGFLGGSQSPETPLEIYLRDDAATLSVSVDSDADTLIVVAPDFAPMVMPKALFTNSRSQSQISGLAPGEYTVLAFDRADGLEYANPAVLSKYLSKGIRVTLAANGKNSVTTDLIRMGE